MATVKECQVCHTDHPVTAERCDNCGSSMLLKVRRPDPSGGQPKLSDPRPGDALAAAEEVYRAAVGKIGVPGEIERRGDGLIFSCQGAQFELLLDPPHNVDLSICYRPSEQRAAVATNSFAGRIDRLTFLQTANALNVAMGHVKAVIEDDQVRFRVCEPLFGEIACSADKERTRAELEFMLMTDLIRLRHFSSAFFAQTRRAFSEAGKNPPDWPPSIQSAPAKDGAAFLRRALQYMGIKATEAGDPQQPDFFIMMADGYIVKVRSPSPRSPAPHFIIEFNFIEERLYNQHTFNVLHAGDAQDLLEFCNAFNRRTALLKSFFAGDGAGLHARRRPGLHRTGDFRRAFLGLCSTSDLLGAGLSRRGRPAGLRFPKLLRTCAASGRTTRRLRIVRVKAARSAIGAAS